MSKLTYSQAGVDIEAGNALVEAIKPAAKATSRAGVVAGLGGFGALFDLKAAGYADPVLVAATMTGWGPSCGSPSTMASWIPSVSIWWRCASTI